MNKDNSGSNPEVHSTRRRLDAFLWIGKLLSDISPPNFGINGM